MENGEVARWLHNADVAAIGRRLKRLPALAEWKPDKWSQECGGARKG